VDAKLVARIVASALGRDGRFTVPPEDEWDVRFADDITRRGATSVEFTVEDQDGDHHGILIEPLPRQVGAGSAPSGTFPAPGSRCAPPVSTAAGTFPTLKDPRRGCCAGPASPSPCRARICSRRWQPRGT